MFDGQMARYPATLHHISRFPGIIGGVIEPLPLPQWLGPVALGLPRMATVFYKRVIYIYIFGIVVLQGLALQPWREGKPLYNSPN